MAFGYGQNAVFEIALYNQNCVMAGRVCADPEGKFGEDWREGGDITVYKGTEAELVKDARERFAVRYDNRAGGMGDAFAHKCARAILAHLGVPEVEESESVLGR